MKEMKNFYYKLFQSANSPKKIFLTILIPFALTFCATLYILAGVMVAAMGSKPLTTLDTTLQEGVSENILRLHVIANSDTKEDQETKLKVKDIIVAYLQSNLKDVHTKEEALSLLSNHIVELKNIATNYLRELGYTYEVEVSVGPAYFPIKTYGDITLLAGEYDALRIKLGDAVGKNWWCIIFPTLCYVDTTYQVVPEESKEELQQLLTQDEYNSIITKKEAKVVVKFKLLDWLKDLL